MKMFKMTTLMILALSTNLSYAAVTGNEGGGGDTTEIRIDEIRSDILKWINNGGARSLELPSDISYGEYEDKMLDILQLQKVIIGAVEDDKSKDEELRVLVNGKPKTCRGFISKKDSRPHILCNIPRFKATSESDQYKLIHHEYAGLKRLEKNEGEISDYKISAQLTDYLKQQTVLKLAVKKPAPVILSHNEMQRACIAARPNVAAELEKAEEDKIYKEFNDKINAIYTKAKFGPIAKISKISKTFSEYKIQDSLNGVQVTLRYAVDAGEDSVDFEVRAYKASRQVIAISKAIDKRDSLGRSLKKGIECSFMADSVAYFQIYNANELYAGVLASVHETESTYMNISFEILK